VEHEERGGVSKVSVSWLLGGGCKCVLIMIMCGKGECGVFICMRCAGTHRGLGAQSFCTPFLDTPALQHPFSLAVCLHHTSRPSAFVLPSLLLKTQVLAF
jgi:hypothetical protein